MIAGILVAETTVDRVIDDATSTLELIRADVVFGGDSVTIGGLEVRKPVETRTELKLVEPDGFNSEEITAGDEVVKIAAGSVEVNDVRGDVVVGVIVEV